MRQIQTTRPELAQVRIEAEALRGVVAANAIGYLVRRFRELTGTATPRAAH